MDDDDPLVPGAAKRRKPRPDLNGPDAD
jgi:hypothetical protein